MKPSNPAKINLKNIKKFIQGWIRSIIFKLSKNKFVKNFADDLKLLQSHQVEQYKWRLTVMNPKCLENGKCIICGCETPYLQMSDESCERKCYPDFMTKENWENYKKENKIEI